MTAPNHIVPDVPVHHPLPTFGPQRLALAHIETALAALDRSDLAGGEVCGYNCSAHMEIAPQGDYVLYDDVIKTLRALAYPNARP